MPTARLFRVAAEVGDPDEATSFYRELFGQSPRPVGGGRLYLTFDGTILALIASRGTPRDLPQDLYFEVDDLEAFHERARKLGAIGDDDVHGEPGGSIVERPWGERSFYAQDPWGNGLCFVQSGTIFTGE